MIDIVQYRRSIGSFRQRLKLRPKKYHNRGGNFNKKYFVNENITGKSASMVLGAWMGTMMLLMILAGGSCHLGQAGQAGEALHGGLQQVAIKYWQNVSHECGVDQVHHGTEYVSFRVKSKQDTPNLT